MAQIGKSSRQGLIQRFLGRLRFPQVFILLVVLFALDSFLPDPIPFVDELILGLLALLVSLWKEKQTDVPLEKPPEKNITPTSEFHSD